MYHMGTLEDPDLAFTHANRPVEVGADLGDVRRAIGRHVERFETLQA